MALHWTAKAPGEVVRYTWTPDLAEGDSLAGFDAAADGATIDAQEQEDDSAILTVSGGTAGAVATFTLTATTSEGETLTETIYLPIRATTATNETAQSICAFALRQIAGLGEDADGAELEASLETLNDMLAAWRTEGAETGVAYPLVASSPMTCRPEFLSAIKHNLALRMADLFGAEVSPVVARQALMGLGTIKRANLPDDRTGEDYY